MAKKIIDDRLHVINTHSTQIATVLNKHCPLNVTQTDIAYLQRTLNIGVHFAQAFIKQQPNDFILWGDSWGKCVQYLEIRFGVKDPNG